MDRGGRGGGGGGGGRDDFFGDPFGGFGGFGGLGGGFGGGGFGGGFGGGGGIGGGFGGMGGGQRSLVSSFFGGRDPFDDPFFNRPSIFGPSMIGPNIFGPPSMFGPSGGMLGEAPPSSGFIENQASQPPNNKSKGPVIEEIVSDDEEEEEEEKGKGQKNENPRKHSRSKEPYVQEPYDEAEERKNKHLQYRNEYNRGDMMQPRTQSFSFQSSSVTYGGTNGAYYTASTTKRMGNDGVVVEESKEADTTTRKATHRLSRGIRDKGHSVTRNLNPDGKVDTMQTLHNLNEDELPVFEETWKGSARKHLPGWNEGFDLLGNTGSSRSGQQEQVQNGGWALPSTEQPQIPDRPYRVNSSNGRTQ